MFHLCTLPNSCKISFFTKNICEITSVYYMGNTHIFFDEKDVLRNCYKLNNL